MRDEIREVLRELATDPTIHTITPENADRIAERAVANITKKDVRDAVREGVNDALLAIGIDTKDALETQQDFAYLRRLRKGTGAMSSRAFVTLIGSIITAIVTLIVIGFRDMFGGGN